MSWFTVLLAMALGAISGYILRDLLFYLKQGDADVKFVGALKEGEYRPIIIKIDKNELGGYSSIVYNRHGTHLTKENRAHFVNLLNHMIGKERDLRSHQFKLLTFKKDD